MKYNLSLQQSRSVPFEDDAGIGLESGIIRRYIENLTADYYRPITRQWTNPIIRFSNLEKEWKQSTAIFSSITEIVMHPSYQQIIGMGPTAIPLIFLSMKREPGHWFWALCAITGENPVNIEQRGKIKDMTDAWLEWGHKQRYLE